MRRRRLGASLVELLVVMLILAVLAAILLPVLGQVKHRARQVACLSNESQIYKALMLYAESNASYLPPYPLEIVESAPKTGTVNPALGWRDAVLPFLGDDRVFFCPSDTLRERVGRLGDHLEDHRYTSYTYLLTVEKFSDPKDPEVVRLKLANIEHPSTTMFIQDPAYVAPPGSTHVVSQHGTTRSLLFFDGHVKAIPNDTFFCAYPGEETGCRPL